MYYINKYLTDSSLSYSICRACWHRT